jgi:hypothetical protein
MSLHVSKNIFSAFSTSVYGDMSFGVLKKPFLTENLGAEVIFPKTRF